jgi:peroxiredoxin
LAVLLALGVFPATATAPVPRKSPDLVIAEPSGKVTRLSSLNGKVVMIEFLVTNCPHCLRIAQTISKLQWETDSRGLRAIGIAFDSGVNAQIVTKFTQQFAISYPVGYVSSDKVDGYLGRSGTERFRVPQIVVIDRKGVIRAQSRPVGERNLEDENYLRNLIDSLLKESASG